MRSRLVGLLAALVAAAICQGADRSPMLVLDAHQDCLRRVLDRGDDLGERIPGTHGDLNVWKKGGCNIVWFSAWIDPRRYPDELAVRRVNNLLGALNQQLRLHPDELVSCVTAADCRAAAAAGKIAALRAIEGGIGINNDISLIEKFRRMGVRRMNLTWRGNLDWAGSSQACPGYDRKPHKEKGLSDFGKQVVREMNRVGMVVDLSHCSDSTFYDAIAVSTKPVICSHSNCRAMAPHVRNITDEMLRKLAEKDGVIGVNFYTEYVKGGGLKERFGAPDLEKVLDLIDHMVKVAGIDHVGIGSDWDGGITPVKGLEDASKLPDLFAGMRKRGYSEEDIRKFAGENFLRVIEANER
ncbi:MAG: dipeptidase [Candidatus Sumerlaeaceae bacterium]|nr:dipeptidase [Candidatus Sumerlaeaceae bacterium]